MPEPLKKIIIIDTALSIVFITGLQLTLFQHIFPKEFIAALILICIYNILGWAIRAKAIGNASQKAFSKCILLSAFKIFFLLLFIFAAFKYSIFMPEVFTYSLLVGIMIVSFSDLFKLNILVNHND